MSFLSENVRTVGSFNYISPAPSNRFPLGIVPCDINGNAVVGEYPVGLTGEHNTFVGCDVASDITSGEENTLVGYNAGRDVTTGSNNVLIGAHAGQNLVASSRNVCIGYEAGLGLVSGTQNVIIGNGIDMGNFNGCISLGAQGGSLPTADYQFLLNGIATNAAAYAGTGDPVPATVETFLPILIDNVEYRIPLYRAAP